MAVYRPTKDRLVHHTTLLSGALTWLFLALPFWLVSCSDILSDAEFQESAQETDSTECRTLLLQAVDRRNGKDMQRYAKKLLLLDRTLAFSTANELAARHDSGFALYVLAQGFSEPFVQQSRSEDPKKRKLATIALGWVRRSPGPEVITALIERLKDEDDDIVMSAIAALGGLRSDSESAIPYLADLIYQADEPFREAAARSIAKISRPHAKRLVKELENEDPEFAEEFEEIITHQLWSDLS